MWRGGLSPVGWRSRPKTCLRGVSGVTGWTCWGCCAAQRGASPLATVGWLAREMWSCRLTVERGFLWRGGLSPVGGRSRPETCLRGVSGVTGWTCWGCCAAQRGRCGVPTSPLATVGWLAREMWSCRLTVERGFLWRGGLSPVGGRSRPKTCLLGVAGGGVVGARESVSTGLAGWWTGWEISAGTGSRRPVRCWSRPGLGAGS